MGAQGEPIPMTATPGYPLRGVAEVPGDKSISHRSLILGALSVGRTTVEGLLEGQDALDVYRGTMSCLGGYLKVCDFGIAKFIHADLPTATADGDHDEGEPAAVAAQPSPGQHQHGDQHGERGWRRHAGAWRPNGEPSAHVPHGGRVDHAGARGLRATKRRR